MAVLDRFSEQRLERACRGKAVKVEVVRNILRAVARKFPDADEMHTIDGVEHNNVSYGRSLGRKHNDATEQAVWDFLVGC